MKRCKRCKAEMDADEIACPQCGHLPGWIRKRAALIRSCHEAAVIFYVLANPIRVHLVAELAQRPTATVGDLASRLSKPTTAVNHHLTVLRKRGLVASGRQGGYIRHWLILPLAVELLRVAGIKGLPITSKRGSAEDASTQKSGA